MNLGSPLLSTDFLIRETLLINSFDGSISSVSSSFSTPTVSSLMSIFVDYRGTHFSLFRSSFFFFVKNLKKNEKKRDVQLRSFVARRKCANLKLCTSHKRTTGGMFYQLYSMMKTYRALVFYSLGVFFVSPLQIVDELFLNVLFVRVSK